MRVTDEELAAWERFLKEPWNDECDPRDSILLLIADLREVRMQLDVAWTEIRRLKNRSTDEVAKHIEQTAKLLGATTLKELGSGTQGPEHDCIRDGCVRYIDD